MSSRNFWVNHRKIIHLAFDLYKAQDKDPNEQQSNEAQDIKIKSNFQ